MWLWNLAFVCLVIGAAGAASDLLRWARTGARRFALRSAGYVLAFGVLMARTITTALDRGLGGHHLLVFAIVAVAGVALLRATCADAAPHLSAAIDRIAFGLAAIGLLAIALTPTWLAGARIAYCEDRPFGLVDLLRASVSPVQTLDHPAAERGACQRGG